MMCSCAAFDGDLLNLIQKISDRDNDDDENKAHKLWNPQTHSNISNPPNLRQTQRSTVTITVSIMVQTETSFGIKM